MFKKEQKPCNDDDVDDVLLQEASPKVLFVCSEDSSSFFPGSAMQG